MGTVEAFEHTADVGMRLAGRDLVDLFQTAAEGLFDLIVANREEIRRDQSEPVDLRADSVEDLLFAWLSELIFRTETRHRLYNGFEIAVSPEGTSLSGRIHGEPIDPERHELDHEVKAVTRHEFEAGRDGDGWRATVIFDV